MDTICVLGKRFSLADGGILRFAETYRLQRKPGQEGNRGRYDTPPPRKAPAPEEFELDPSFQPFEETPREAHGPAPKAPVNPAHEHVEWPQRTPADLFERMMETQTPLPGKEEPQKPLVAPPVAPSEAKMPGKLYAPEAAGKGKGERQRIMPGIRGEGIHGKNLPGVRSDVPEAQKVPAPDTQTPPFPAFQAHENALEKIHRELTPQEKAHIDTVVEHLKGQGKAGSIDPMHIAMDMDAPVWRIAHHLESQHGIPARAGAAGGESEEPTQHSGPTFNDAEFGAWLNNYRKLHGVNPSYEPTNQGEMEQKAAAEEARIPEKTAQAQKLAEYARGGVLTPQQARAGASRLSLESPEVTVQKFLQGWMPQET